MSATDLSEFFASNAKYDRRLVLASVFNTEGATYSKTGAFMLINDDGLFQGMLSGGCLEGDLAERARQVATDNLAQRVTYDLSQNDEDLWGLGVGCDGQMSIFLQPLLAGDKYEPLASMLDVLQRDDVEIIAIVIESTSAAAPEGASLVSSAGSYRRFGLQPTAAAILESAAENVLSDGCSTTRNIRIDRAEVSVLFALLKPPPKVLVLGAGLDAEPVVNLCAELGWRVTIADHRPAYIEKGKFAAALHVLCGPAESLAGTVDLQQFDAAIVMSHHLATDRTYLDQLATTEITYIGLLGPKQRRVRLMHDLGDKACRLDARLSGPAGLDIGGRGPASIALSIVSEMHAKLLMG